MMLPAPDPAISGQGRRQAAVCHGHCFASGASCGSMASCPLRAIQGPGIRPYPAMLPAWFLGRGGITRNVNNMVASVARSLP
jgi:hypothetical protein